MIQRTHLQEAANPRHSRHPYLQPTPAAPQHEIPMLFASNPQYDLHHLAQQQHFNHQNNHNHGFSQYALPHTHLGHPEGMGISQPKELPVLQIPAHFQQQQQQQRLMQLQWRMRWRMQEPNELLRDTMPERMMDGQSRHHEPMGHRGACVEGFRTGVGSDGVGSEGDCAGSFACHASVCGSSLLSESRLSASDILQLGDELL